MDKGRRSEAQMFPWNEEGKQHRAGLPCDGPPCGKLAGWEQG